MTSKRSVSSYSDLLKRGVPAVLIPGLILALTLGWHGNPLKKDTYHQITEIFPHKGILLKVQDGDTFTLKTGQVIRLIGVEAPNRGHVEFEKSGQILESYLRGNTIYMEYDRYQDDKYGRILAWVWINCENSPHFLPPDYMRLSKNKSKQGLQTNPQGCKNGILINEVLIKKGYAEFIAYKDRGELKYQNRILK